MRILSLALSFLCVFQAQAFDTQKPFQQSLWDFEFVTDYYSAVANYTRSGGQFVRLTDGNSFSLVTLDPRIRWGASSKTAFWVGTQIGFANSQTLNVTRTNSVLNHVSGGFDYLWKRTRTFDLIADVEGIFPLQRVDVNSDKVPTGEGAIEIKPRLLTKFRWGTVSPFAYAGFHFRDEGRATLLPYGAGAELRLSKSFLGAELRGYTSVTDDENINTPAAKEAIAGKSGGALRFFTVNPSLLEARAWWRSQPMHGWGYKIEAGTSMTGSATSAGFDALFAMNYRWRTVPLQQSEPADIDFVENTDDGVDQSLFGPAKPKNSVPKSQSSPNSSPSKTKIKDELNETEKLLEERLD